MIGLVKRKEWALVANPGWRIPLPLDSLHRTTLGQIEDRASWRYGYDDRDQLTAGKRYWSDSQPVAGQQFEYAYDNIGNRIISKSGGDERGAGLRPASYGVNDANEYTTITNVAYKDILGAALNDSSVSINGGSADRKTEYFHREIAVTNASGPCWTPVTASVTSASSNWSTSGGLVLPGQSQALSYDTSGNLTFDGIWQYRWDSENRLADMVMTNVANIPSAQRKKLEFAYDYQGRRIGKKVSQWNANSNAFVQATNYLFLYDGWNLLAILSSDLRPQTTFTWGLDLSGSEEGAGGIGGLLFESQILNPQFPNPQYVCYDGNGNVSALLATDGALAARYEYSPFGVTLRATAPMAQANPFLSSTKFTDYESGLLYYGLRFYSAALGRWISRDPNEEAGGANLYGFCANNPVNVTDPFGLFQVWGHNRMIDNAFGNETDSKFYLSECERGALKYGSKEASRNNIYNT